MSKGGSKSSSSQKTLSFADESEVTAADNARVLRIQGVDGGIKTGNIQVTESGFTGDEVRELFTAAGAPVINLAGRVADAQSQQSAAMAQIAQASTATQTSTERLVKQLIPLVVIGGILVMALAWIKK